MNTKYEITDIAHEKYPFLHRIRALRDIGSEVKAGDLGGFVECESNLSFETGDDAWIFDNAIAAGEGCVDKGSVLREGPLSVAVLMRPMARKCSAIPEPRMTLTSGEPD